MQQTAVPLSLVINKLSKLGYAGPGAIGKKSLTAYIGRYLDKKSGKIKTIGKPNFIFNKTDWASNY